MLSEKLIPHWSCPTNVKALQTLRSDKNGVSRTPWSSFNLANHVGDDPAAVHANRAILQSQWQLPAPPCWLNQVHGTTVVEAKAVMRDDIPTADAVFTRQKSVVCAVLTADCLPVLFCDEKGSVVAAAHAGWRSLCAGVLESTIKAMAVDPANIMAWLGPAIGPSVFVVGEEVRTAFMAVDKAAAKAFVPALTENNKGKWLSDIYLLAKQRLAGAGITKIEGGGLCTVSDAAQFFSYRRDGTTGRMASLIWLDSTD